MIAVTGSNGLVGSYLVRKFLEEGLPVAAIIRKTSNTTLLDEYREKITWREADVLDIPSLTEALTGVDTVVHSAGMVSLNPRRTKRIFEVNVEGTRNVVNTCLALNIRRMIHISSVAALGRVKGLATIDEGNKWASSPLNSDYGESKHLGELEVYRGIEEGLNTTILNPSVVLAPADWDNSSAQLFHYVWKESSFYTEGTINYIDARDVAEMVFRIYAGDFSGQKFIASAGALPLLGLLTEIGKRFHKKPPFVKVSSRWTGLLGRTEEIRSWLAGTEPLITRQSARLSRETFYYNPQRAKDVLQMQFRPLEETLDWCCSYYLRQNTIKK